MNFEYVTNCFINGSEHLLDFSKEYINETETGYTGRVNLEKGISFNVNRIEDDLFDIQYDWSFPQLTRPIEDAIIEAIEYYEDSLGETIGS
jgi:hypothetical protein